MSLRSTLSTICIRFVIAFFVQERIFVYGNECLCKCNTNDVCDELERLATNDDTKRGELEKWKIYIPFLKTLHQNFDLELLFERLTKIENKIDSTEDLKGKLKETESHVTRLEDALENVKKEFEKKMADFAQEMRDVQSKTMTLEGNVKEAEKVITATKINVSTINERMHVVENQMKLFLPVIEAEKRTGDQLKINISTIESRMNVLENQIKNFELVTEEEKRNREELEENMEIHREFMSNFERNDMKFQIITSEMEQRLSNVENEVENFTVYMKAEKKAREDLEEEMLRNTSKRFSNVNKQYRNLKNDFDRKVLNVIEDTKLLKSDVEKEKSARKNYSEENMKTYRNITSIIERKDMKFQTAISKAEQRLSNVENEVEKFETSIKAEREARQELKENMETHQNVMSIAVRTNRKYISEAEQRLSNVEYEVENCKASIKAEKEAIEELEVKLRTNFSTTSRLNNEEHSEIRKNLTSIERELSNLQRIISLKDRSFNKLEVKVKDISRKMPVLESELAEEKAAREDIERKIKLYHPLKSLIF